MLLKLFIGQIDTKLLKTAAYEEQPGINKISVNYHYWQGNKISSEFSLIRNMLRIILRGWSGPIHNGVLWNGVEQYDERMPLSIVWKSQW